MLLAGSRSDGSIVSWTCDAPMCAEHALTVGHMSGNEPETIDYCPYHVDQPRRPLKELIMFEREAERRRREIHAEIRRARMALAEKVQEGGVSDG